MFKVGDRVIALSRFDDNQSIVGEIGTVLSISPIIRATQILIEFDKHIGGHDGEAGLIRGKKGHCWWVQARYLRKSSGKPISIKEKIMLNCEHLYKF